MQAQMDVLKNVEFEDIDVSNTRILSDTYLSAALARVFWNRVPNRSQYLHDALDSTRPLIDSGEHCSIQQCILKAICFPKGSFLPTRTIMECPKKVKLSFEKVYQQGAAKTNAILQWMLQVCNTGSSNTVKMDLRDRKMEAKQPMKQRKSQPGTRIPERSDKNVPSDTDTPNQSVLNVLQRIGLISDETRDSDNHANVWRVTSDGLQFCLSSSIQQTFLLFRGCVCYVLQEMWSFLLPPHLLVKERKSDRATISLFLHSLSNNELSTRPLPISSPEELIGNLIEDRLLKFSLLLLEHRTGILYMYPKSFNNLVAFLTPKLTGVGRNAVLSLLESMIATWPSGPEGKLLDMLATVGLIFKGMAQDKNRKQDQVHMTSYYAVHPSICQEGLRSKFSGAYSHFNVQNLFSASNSTNDSLFRCMRNLKRFALNTRFESPHSQPCQHALEVIVETNFRVYAYCHAVSGDDATKEPSSILLHKCLISQFANIVTSIRRGDNLGSSATRDVSESSDRVTWITVLVIAQITYESVMQAYRNGITATQIVDFIERNKHLEALCSALGREGASHVIMMHKGKYGRGGVNWRESEHALPSPIPDSVREQLYQWESEARRLSFCLSIEEVQRESQALGSGDPGGEMDQPYYDTGSANNDSRYWIPIGGGMAGWRRLGFADFKKALAHLHIPLKTCFEFDSKEEMVDYLRTIDEKQTPICVRDKFFVA